VLGAESISCSTFRVASVQLSVYNKFPGRGATPICIGGYSNAEHMCGGLDPGESSKFVSRPIFL